MPVQYFSPNGLAFLFNQLNIGASPFDPAPTYKVGLFTGTLQEIIDAGSMTQELDAAGYSRLITTFGSPTEAYPVGSIGTTLSANSNAGDWFITVYGSPSLQIGMTVQLIDEDPLVITGLPDGQVGASIRIVLSGALSTSHSSGEGLDIGDAVAGSKSTGSAVLFSALATWPAVGGYFVVADAQEYDASNYIYAATFADATTPILGPNDTLQVTPTWLMSS